MVCSDSLKENLPRIAAFCVISVALVFDYRSMKMHEDINVHSNFDMASAITPFAGILNVIGRTLDHHKHPEKKLNMAASVPVIMLQTIQCCFSILSTTQKYEQSIALPVLLGSLTLMCFSFVNWEPVAADDEKKCVRLLQKNAGRLLGIGAGTAGAVTAVFSIKQQSKTLFFAASAMNSLGSACESFSRVLDIVHFEKDKTNAINKLAILIFFGLIIVGTALTATSALNVWQQPIDLTATLFRIHMLFYMVAQYRFKPKQESEALIPETVSLTV